jgi:nitrogen regulatory protein P-II 1
MVKIEAIIRKSKFKEVKLSLINEGFHSFNYLLIRSVSDKSEKRFYRGVEYDAKSADRVQLSLFIPNDKKEAALNIIKDAGDTGDADDNYVYVIEVNEAYKLVGGEDQDTLKDIK